MKLHVALLSAAFATSALTSAIAAETQPVLEMHAEGELHIATDGHVTDYQLKSALAPAVAELVDHKVRSWHFEPIVIDGQPVAARTALHLDLSASPSGSKDTYTLRIANVRFGEPRASAGMKPPRYPQEAVRVGLGARVLVSVRVDEAGNVIDVQPYQTNLNARPSSEVEAKHWREVFERASVAAIKNWHFELSETVDGKPLGTTVIVPFAFTVKGGPIRSAKPGEWQAYLPGPVHPASWLKSAAAADNAELSALKDGQALSLESRFHLKDSGIGSTL